MPLLEDADKAVWEQVHLALYQRSQKGREVVENQLQENDRRPMLSEHLDRLDV